MSFHLAGGDRRAPLRRALERSGQFGPGQTAGRFYPIACVALEVTQRCNLDCTLCYLSDTAEMAHDVPLQVLMRRIASIDSHYGLGTSIQITGGDPTLRRPEDLEALCRAIRARGMRSCLMTNGVRASRALLKRLAGAGLDDVAFHVDLTQERRGFPTEASLDTLREEYIRRAAGLGLRILFNTTVHDGNIAELPALARFFRAHAAEVAIASFQLQAATGRGTLRERGDAVTLASVMAGISEGFGAALDCDAADVGHRDCTRYASVLVAGKRAVSLLGDRALVEEVIAALEASGRSGPYLPLAAATVEAAFRNPGLALRVVRHVVLLLWRLRRDWWSSGGRASRLTVIIHNFMDAEALDEARCDSCVFMVATEEGPVSMCVHNAERDRHVFAPARLETPEGPRYWNAADGSLAEGPVRPDVPELPTRRTKGRARAAAMAARRKEAE